MSARQLLKTYHSGLFYFPSDKTLMIIPTKLIQEEMYQAGMVVKYNKGCLHGDKTTMLYLNL